MLIEIAVIIIAVALLPVALRVAFALLPLLALVAVIGVLIVIPFVSAWQETHNLLMSILSPVVFLAFVPASDSWWKSGGRNSRSSDGQG